MGATGFRARHRPPDPERVASTIDASLVGGRSPAELLDAFCGAVRAALPDVLVAVYVLAADGVLRLEAQAGYPTVVHEVPLGTGVFGRAMTAGTSQVVYGPQRDADYLAATPGVTSIAAIPFALHGARALVAVETLGEVLPEWAGAVLFDGATSLGLAIGELSARARMSSPATRLSRAFVRIAAQGEAGPLLELLCRTVGEMLGLRVVLCLRGEPSAMSPVSTWRRTHGESPDPTVEEVVAHANALGWEAGRVVVGERAIVIVPLRAYPDLVGLLAGVAPVDAEIGTAQLEEVELVAAHAANALRTVERYQTVVAASLTDALTGLPNHRRFHEDGATLIDAARATGSGFSLVVADLDDFKDLNDRRGHVAGDDALRLVGSLLERGIRPDDRAYRVGGEEFGLLLPATTKTNARTVCRRLQRALAQIDLDGWKLTQSMGVASFPEDGETIRDLLAASDAALYEAKRLGKDRITIADEQLSARRTQGETMAVRGRRSFEQMRHLQALAASLGGARTTAAVGEAVLTELAAALPHDASALIVSDQSGPIVAAARGAEGRQSAVLALAERAIAERRSFLLDDASGEFAALAGGALRGVVAAPLVAEDRIVGAIVVLASTPSRYDRDDQRLLDVIAHIGGLACENVSLLAEVEQVGLAAIRAAVAADAVALRWLDADGPRPSGVVAVADASGGEVLLLPVEPDGVLELRRDHGRFSVAEQALAERVAGHVGSSTTSGISRRARLR